MCLERCETAAKWGRLPLAWHGLCPAMGKGTDTPGPFPPTPSPSCRVSRPTLTIGAPPGPGSLGRSSLQVSLEPRPGQATILLQGVQDIADRAHQPRHVGLALREQLAGGTQVGQGEMLVLGFPPSWHLRQQCCKPLLKAGVEPGWLRWVECPLQWRLAGGLALERQHLPVLPSLCGT